MKLTDAVGSAVEAIRANILRSILTMLGIVIGVAAVILVVAIGSGAREAVIEQIRSLGANLIMIDARGSLWLSYKDALAIEAEVPGVRLAAPVLRGGASADRGSIHWNTSVNGANEEFLEARDWPLIIGRNFSEDEQTSGAKVALIGATVADLLFADENPVGSVMMLKDIPFTIIGVLASKGQSNTGRDQDDVVVVPLKTANSRVFGANPINPDRIDTVLVKVQDGWSLDQVEKQIRALFRQKPRLASSLNDTITIKNVEEVLRIKEASAGSLQLLVGIIASISLLVGGIGIMNIMLVSVVERTREIGVRLAVGARRADVLLQFLVEAATLSSLGGAVGLVVGILGAVVVAQLADWPFVINLAAIVLAVGFSMTVGVLFGFYPARRASRLDPIEALRHE